MLVVSSDVDMATGGNEASFDRGKKSMFPFLRPWLRFLQHMYTYIDNPIHLYFEN